MGMPESHLPQYSNDEGWLTGFPFDLDAEFKATYWEFQNHDRVVICGSLSLLRMIGRKERIWPETSYGESGSAISSNGAQLRSSEPDLRSVHCRIARATLL